MEQVHEKAYIYLITVVEKQSSSFSMKYVGKSNGNDKRYITGGTILRHIIKKYGTGSIDKVILIKQPMTNEQMNELEKFYINYYDTFNNGLNLTLGGEGMSGRIMSYETKEKISNSRKGIIYSDETKEKMKLYALNRPNEHMDKIRNKTLYSFIHKDGTIEENITMYDFYTKYNINKFYINRLCRNERKTTKGWALFNTAIKTDTTE